MESQSSWKKIAGVTYVNKLRAICLFEADFNYWTKLVFARRMMKKAREEGGLPDDIYSRAGGHCDDATMTKVMFCDDLKIIRHPAAIFEADLEECYDWMAHLPTSLAVQSWGLPVNSAKIVLTALRLMQFCIRTGFGESPELFGGTDGGTMMRRAREC